MAKLKPKMLVPYGLGFGLLAWVVAWNWHAELNGAQVGLALVFERSVCWMTFGIALALGALSLFFTILRWYVLVCALDLPFRFADAIRLGLIGNYLSTFLPGSVGGDVVKAVAIARKQNRRTSAVATVVFDRILGFWALFWLVAMVGSVMELTGVLESLVRTQAALAVLHGILLSAIGLSLSGFAFWFVMGCFPESWCLRTVERLENVPRIGRPLAELWRALWLFRRRGRHVALAIGLSLIGHVGSVLTFYHAVKSLIPTEIIPSLLTHFLAVPFGMTIQAGIPTPGGVGGGECGFGLVYHLFGYVFAAGATGSLAFRAVRWTLGFLGYLIYLGMTHSQVLVSSNESQ